MTTDDKPIPDRCLFFTESGAGPSECRLIIRDVREQRIAGQVAVPRAFGLCWRTESPPFFVEDGGFMLTTDTATWLRDQLTAWLDAPRLAARETPEVVAEIGGVRLLRADSEWGVLWQSNGGDTEGCWYPSEAEAREVFCVETRTVECYECGRFVNYADVEKEGIYNCPDGAGCNVETPAAEVTP